MNSYVKRLSLLTAALTVAAVLILPAGTLHGDEWNFKTFITVSHPFQVPGAVLQPNVKYVMKRLGGLADGNHIVQVFNENQSNLITTFFAIPEQRLEPADGTMITFYETAPGYPKPMRSWFYPGRDIGLEFLYSKAEREQIALHAPGARATIQTAELTMPPAPTEPAVVAPEPVVEETPAVTEETQIAQNTEPEIQREKPADTEAVAQDTSVNDNNNNQTALPATAGELPLLGLIGFASLALRQVLRKG